MCTMRVLITDEDVLVRRAIAKVVADNTYVSETITSKDVGKSEELIERVNPDLVLLNIEQAEESDYKRFTKLRARFPKLPVVVISTRSEKGAGAAIDALRKGAVDVITKPKANAALLLSTNHLKKRLPPILQGVSKMLSKENVDQWLVEKVNREEVKGAENKISGKSSQPVNLVVIGGSMGAPRTLKKILKKISGDFPVPIVIAQHFPRYYTRALTKELTGITDLTVREATGDFDLMPGSVWVASGGTHCQIQQSGNRSFLKVHRGPRENGVRPSIDVLFRSAARLYGSGVLGILLSGIGTDGVAGSRAIDENDGRLVVQDPGDAVIDELPLSVIRSGFTSEYYPAEQISDQVEKYVSQSNEKVQTARSYHFNLHKRKPEYFRSV